MGAIAAIIWFAAIGFGVFLLGIWLVELDRDAKRSAATRFPVPVISAHAMLAIGGVPVWLAYLVTDDQELAWLAVAILAGVAVLGATMAIRWIGVLRSIVPDQTPAMLPGSGHVLPVIPAERKFPPVAVICHGLAAITTVTLVVLAALGVGGS
jgi:hypothetical protein